MNEIEIHRYDYLRRKRYVVHEEHEQSIRPETLSEMREYEAVEFYNRERIRELKGISKKQRNNMLAEAAAPAFDHKSVARALVLGLNVETVDDRHPYDVLAVFGKPS